MKKILLIGSGLVLAVVVCLQVWGATSALTKTTSNITSNAVAITYANDKTELVCIYNRTGTETVTVSAVSSTGSNGVAILAPGGSVTFSAGANARAGMKLYAWTTGATANITNTVFAEQWIGN